MAGDIGLDENATSQAPPSIEVTLSTGVFSAETSKRFALQKGGSLRIGRDATNHVVLDVNGVSSTHVELLFQSNELVSAEAPPELCIRDHSRNGTSIRPGPHVIGSGWANKKIPTWERLQPGVPRALAHGWQVLAPARSRKGASQIPFHKRMVTVYTNASSIPVATKVADAAQALPENKAPVATLQQTENKVVAPGAPIEQVEKKRKRDRKADDPAREKKKKPKVLGEESADTQAAATAAAAAAAAAVAAEHRRRVEQTGAVEEEIARQEMMQQGVVAPEVARTARPKRKAQAEQVETSLPAEAPGVPPPLPRMQPLSTKKVAPAPAAARVDEEAEAAARAVAAAAALRVASQKKPPVTLKQLRQPATEEIVDSDVESTAPPRTVAPLTQANVATLGGSGAGGGSVLEFDLRSISPISAPGVNPKKKKKVAKASQRAPVSPSVDRRAKKRDAKKTRLLAASAPADESPAPDRWKPSPGRGGKANKKRSARSDSERVRPKERKGRR